MTMDPKIKHEDDYGTGIGGGSRGLREDSDNDDVSIFSHLNDEADPDVDPGFGLGIGGGGRD